MSASLTFNAYSKMYTYTEEAVLKVRRELLRLGCKHDDIDVMQHMTCLKLVYDNQELIAKPFEVLATLKSIRNPVKAIDVWAILCLSQQDKLEKSNKRTKMALYASLLSLIFLLLYLGLAAQVI